MEIKKIPCKTLYIKWKNYTDFSKDDEWRGFTHHKTRPVKKYDDNLYKFKNYRELVLTTEEIEDFKNSYLISKSQESMSYRKFIKNFVGHNVIGFDNETVEDYSTWNHFACRYLRESWSAPAQLELTAEPPFYYFDFDDGEEVPYNEKELAVVKAKNSQEADIKIIENMLMPSLNNILDKYNLLYDHAGIRFKNYKAYTTTIKKLFEDTIVKDLKENGFDAKIDSKIRSFKYDTYLIQKKDLKLKLNNNNELS